MRLNVEKALQVCGNSNKYQKLLYIAVALTWFSVDFVSITFPLLELLPNFKCKSNSTSEWYQCSDVEACKLDTMSRRYEVEYSNILTDFDLACQQGLVMLIGVIYTIGIVIGAFFSSKFSDSLGRKPVLLISYVLFILGAFLLTISPNIYLTFVLLFFIGFACAGGTMVSYLFIYEVISTNKRSIYGTLINSSFAVAGILYFTAFRLIKNWKIIAYISCSASVIAGSLVLFYFVESPRYYISTGQTQKALKAFFQIAKKNGKLKDYYKYLVSDLFMKNDSKLLGDNTAFESTEANISVAHSTSPKKDLEGTHKDAFEDFCIQFNQNESFITYNMNIKEEPLLDNKIGHNSEVETATKKEESFLSLIKYKSIRSNFLICNFLWFAMSFTYYGISLVLKKDGNDVFLDGYVVYGAEGISYMVTGIIISIAFFGRVRTLTIMLCLTSLSTTLFFFVKYLNFPNIDKVFLFAARFSITSVYSIMYTYSTELYPTSIRSKGLGINTLFARMAGILVPVIVELFDPFLIFGSLCLVGFILTFMLPETFGKELEDEIQERINKKDDN